MLENSVCAMLEVGFAIKKMIFVVIIIIKREPALPTEKAMCEKVLRNDIYISSVSEYVQYLW